jgi:hypothetical protein
MARARAREGKEFGPRAFDKRKDAERYEEHCKLFGEEPPVYFRRHHGDHVQEGGGRGQGSRWPRGRSLSGRDKSGEARREYVIGLIGHYDVGDVDTGVLEKIIADLAKRGDSNATINRYLHAALGVPLTLWTLSATFARPCRCNT